MQRIAHWEPDQGPDVGGVGYVQKTFGGRLGQKLGLRLVVETVDGVWSNGWVQQQFRPRLQTGGWIRQQFRKRATLRMMAETILAVERMVQCAVPWGVAVPLSTHDFRQWSAPAPLPVAAALAESVILTPALRVQLSLAAIEVAPRLLGPDDPYVGPLSVGVGDATLLVDGDGFAKVSRVLPEDNEVEVLQAPPVKKSDTEFIVVFHPGHAQ
jgi:hypothetical protein